MHASGCYRYWMARRRFRRSWKGRVLASRFESLLCGPDRSGRAVSQAARFGRLHPAAKRARRRVAEGVK